MGIGFGMDNSFVIFHVMFMIIFVLVIGMFVVIAVKGISQWNKNNHSPRLTVPAAVVAKRTNVSTRRDRHGSTTYYVTFQVDSGDRMELHLAGYEYGLLVEGDQGNLTFQGTRFLSFERK